MAKAKKSKVSKSTKKATGFMGLINDISGALMGSNIEIKFNGHEIIKDPKNNISYSLTKDNVKTAVHYRDKGYGFERKQVKQTPDVVNSTPEEPKSDNK